MQNAITPSFRVTQTTVIYRDILLDADFCYYTYINPLPVLMNLGTGVQVGIAYLKKWGKMLYGEFRLENNRDYSHLYPYLPFDPQGNLGAVLLSPEAHFDESIMTFFNQLHKKA